MKSFHGGAPFTIKFRCKLIKSRPDLCRLMGVIYFRETRKRFCFNLPGYFPTDYVARIDSNGKALDPREHQKRSDFNSMLNRIFYWRLYAAAGIEDLDRSGVEVKDFTKSQLDNFIKASLKKGGIL